MRNARIRWKNVDNKICNEKQRRATSAYVDVVVVAAVFHTNSAPQTQNETKCLLFIVEMDVIWAQNMNESIYLYCVESTCMCVACQSCKRLDEFVCLRCEAWNPFGGLNGDKKRIIAFVGIARLSRVYGNNTQATEAYLIYSPVSIVTHSLVVVLLSHFFRFDILSLHRERFKLMTSERAPFICCVYVMHLLHLCISRSHCTLAAHIHSQGKNPSKYVFLYASLDMHI